MFLLAVLDAGLVVTLLRYDIVNVSEQSLPAERVSECEANEVLLWGGYSFSDQNWAIVAVTTQCHL